jgi:hypothetical protein
LKASPILILAAVLGCAVSIQAQPDSLWSRTYGGEGLEFCYSLIQTADGGLALSGWTNSFGAGETDFWLVRTDEDGDSLWSRAFGGGIWEDCLSLIQTADGGFALAGKTYSFGAGGIDFWLVQTNENGDSLWSRTFGGPRDDVCSSLVQTADGGFALAGGTCSFSVRRNDFWLVRTDENGDSLWSRRFGGMSYEGCSSLIQTADGGFALAGHTISFDAGYTDIWLVRTDENGDSLWSRTFGGEHYDYCTSLIQTADGGFVLAGFTQSFGAGDFDFWLVRTDANGDSLWSRTFGGRLADWCYSLIRTADGGFALAGSTESFRAGNRDFWLVKTGPDPVSVPNSKLILHPSAFIIYEPFPNPFNSAAVASYELRVAGPVSLSLYDTGGRLVKTLADGWTTAGTHRVHWNADELPSGRYNIILGDDRRALDAKGVTLVK